LQQVSDHVGIVTDGDLQFTGRRGVDCIGGGAVASGNGSERTRTATMKA